MFQQIKTGIALTLTILPTFWVLAQQKLSISGHVLDSLERPIEGATLALHPGNIIYKTDKNGFFIFDDLYQGRYDIHTSSIGYKTITKSLELEEKNEILKFILSQHQEAIAGVEVNETIRAVDNLILSKNAAMPVQVITRREIELMGSRRLDEVLKEQTGVAVVNDVSSGSRASGVQIQGFSSNYIMVLVDGQPLLGRNSGNFDLSRISVTNIERIEIIKGATSCLYGSDALGGAINIITRQGALTPQAQASVLYGSLNIVDATVEAETPFANQRGSVVISGNYYRTDGYNTDDKYMNLGTTIAPYDNYSFQGRGRYRISDDGTFGLTARYAQRNSTMYNGWSSDQLIKDTQQDKDLHLAANYDHSFQSGLRTMSRYFYTYYQNDMQAEWIRQSSLISVERFTQQVHRFEQQFAYAHSTTLKFTGGLGGSIELMNSKDFDNEKNLQTGFAYLQTEWSPLSRLHTTLGLRYDLTNIYDNRLSPSLGLQYEITPTLTAKAGVGAGFKAPDYKMRYQVFYNPSANYMVIGADKVQDVIQAMEDNGEISHVNRYILDLAANNLKSENSISSNIGFVWAPTQKTRTEVSGFYHRINDQISTVSVATGTRLNQLYTYRNLPKVVNKGVEISTAYQLIPDLELSAGYQYLIAKDLSVLDSIRANVYPYNKDIINPNTGESHAPTVKDYWGLEDRSKHMFNFKALYQYRPWDLNFNLRVNIRGKYAFQETTTNQFIDKYDAFVPSHTLVNLTVEKNLWDRKLTLRLIADNLFDYTHRYMLGQPGRVILGGLTYRIK